MAGSNMEDRIKEGPLMPKFNAVMTKYKEMAKMKSVAALIPDIKSFDKNLEAGTKLVTDSKASLLETIGTARTANQKGGKIIGDHMKGIDDLKKADDASVKKVAAQFGGALAQSTDKALDVFKDYVDDANDFLVEINTIFKDITDAREEYISALNKSFEDARKIIAKADTDKKKLESDCNSLEASIRKAVVEVQQDAVKSHNDKLATSLKTFLTSL
jgi:hypothetical protein